MLKRTITYEDFNGETVHETFYFNLTKSELIELEVSYKEGLGAALQRIIETDDRKAIIGEFKRLILISYGERDGSRFVKNDEMRTAFSQTAAYDALFMELATDDGAAAAFIKGVVPKDVSMGIPEDIPTLETSTALPPPPPVL